MTHCRFLLPIAVLCLGLAFPSGALVNSALQLDGRDACLEVPHSPGLHADRALSVTGWFRADGSPAERGWQALLWKGDTPDRSPYGNREYGLWLSGARRLQLASTPAGATPPRALMLDSGGARIQAGRWHHFAVVIDADRQTTRLFLDGRQVAEGSYPASGLRTTSGPLRLGGIPERDHFQGLLDEVRIWGRALTPADVTRDLHTPLLAGARDLLAAYTFDGLDSEGRVPDVSGNGHTGRLVGGARLTSVRVLAPPAAVISDSSVFAITSSASPPVRPIRGELADVLIDAFDSDDYRIRAQAAQSIEQVAQEDLARVLRHGLASEHYEVRSRAADALGRLDQLAAGAGETEEMIARSGAVAVMDLPPVSPRSSPSPRRHRIDGNAYRDWEARWEAPRPDDWDLDPEGLLLRYNRVEGIYAGWQLPRTYRRTETLTHFGSAGYGLASKTLRYQAGGELYTFYSPANSPDGRDANLSAVGGELHDLTDTQDGWLLPEEENSVDAFLFRRDFRDYYRRRGWSAYTAHNVGGILQLTARYQWDEFGSVATSAGWGLFGGRLGRADFRPNPTIDAGQIRSLRADVQLDTRDRRWNPGRGWLANALFERAGGFLGGEARFKRYLADVRRYQPVGRGARIDLRLRLGTAKERLPSQYLFDLGGYGSLRGYDYKAVTGDRMILANAEYWIDADRQWRANLPADDLRLGAFLDTGAAWTAADADDPFDGLAPLLGSGSDPGDPEWQTSVGLAAGFGDSARLYAAHPLSGSEDWRLSLRFSRTF